MINQVYATVQSIINKENSGYVSPEEFNHVAKQVQDNIFKSYFEDYNRDKNRENKGLTNQGVGNLAVNQAQRLTPFYDSAPLGYAGGTYLLPTDIYYIQDKGVTTDVGRVIEEIPPHQTYLAISEFGPSLIFPGYTRKDNVLTVLPSTYVFGINVNYMRHPVDPKWTYTVINEQELYDPSKLDFQDFELQEIEFPNIVLQMLTYFGINLREGQVIQVAEGLKNTENIKDNS